VSYACITEWEAIHPTEVRIHSVCQGELTACCHWLLIKAGEGQARIRPNADAMNDSSIRESDTDHSENTLLYF